MTAVHKDAREDILTRVREGVMKSDLYKGKYKKYDSWLLVISIVLGAIATALAGGGAAGGKPLMDALGGWRAVCSLAATLTAIATISGALHRTLRISDKLSSAISCSAKLRSLELEIAVTTKEAKETLVIYERILREHPDCF